MKLLAILAALVAPAAEPRAAEPPTECALVSLAHLDCRDADWRRWPESELDSVAQARDVAALLSDLLEGRDTLELRRAVQEASSDDERRALMEREPDPLACLRRSAWAEQAGCPDESCLLRRLDELESDCAEATLRRALELAESTDSRPVRLGAMVLAYYPGGVDGEAGRRLEAELAAAARRLLERELDPLSRTGLLTMLETHPLPAPELLPLLGRHARSGSEMVRVAAMETLWTWTACPLMQDWSPPDAPTEEQVKALLDWASRE